MDLILEKEPFEIFTNESCDVRQYGVSITDALCIDHMSVSSCEDINLKVITISQDGIIWNGNPVIPEFCLLLSRRVPQLVLSICLHHGFDVGVLSSPIFDSVASPKRTCAFRHKRLFNCGRAVQTWLLNEETGQSSDRMGIDKFEFAAGLKGLHRLIDLAWQKFVCADIALYISVNWKVDLMYAHAQSLIDQMRQNAGDHFLIDCPSDFLGKQEMLDWLRKNKLKVFPYNPGLNSGSNSNAALALGSGSPALVTQSSLLRHYNSLLLALENFNSTEIIKPGTVPHKPLFYQ